MALARLYSYADSSEPQLLVDVISTKISCILYVLGDLLKNTAELVDVLLDLEPDLCVSWATDDFIQALLEATEQIGYV